MSEYFYSTIKIDEHLLNKEKILFKISKINSQFKEPSYSISNTDWNLKRDDWFNLYNEVKEAGGDGFYGGLSVPYQEPVMKHYNYIHGSCPNAELVQPKMMQFKTNYRNLLEAREKINILNNIIKKRK